MASMNGQGHNDIINRLKSIEGHVRGVARMVENDVPCLDVITQIAAVQAALHRVKLMMLNHHLQTCLETVTRTPHPEIQNQMIEQIINLFETGEKI